MLLLDEPFGMLDSLTRFELQQVLLELWRKDRKTALMVTHDVDEALFLSDRVVCMTDGPEAEVGEILAVPFERPRVRSEIMQRSEYYELREQLISFLNDRAHQRKPASAPKPESPDQSGDADAHPKPKQAAAFDAAPARAELSAVVS
jgi:ABC-type nitrate/sulfonate/bicarbonate transport system ATPase subunit